MIEISTLQQHVIDFLDQTEEARTLSERDRDYYNNRQWTPAQIAIMEARHQAPVVDNRIKPKVEGLKGLLVQRRTDPKGYARTQAHEEASEAVTDALRYVSDNVEFDSIELDCFDNLIVEGYGGCIIDTRQTRRGPEIKIDLIPWDRIYFDPHSRRPDFKDAQYMGIVLWMDVDVAIQTFPKKKTEIEAAANNNHYSDETFEDRPFWADSHEDRTRIRIMQEFYLHKGKWHMCVFAGDQFLVKPVVSPYLDEDGEPTNPIELVGAYIDRANYRYGEVRYWIDPQNEINKRRSKFLHFLSSRQTFSTKGAVKDPEQLKRELKKPEGHVEIEHGEFGKTFGIIPDNDMAEAQYRLLEEAKQTLDSVSFNAQLSGERQGDLSGRAVEQLQLAGMLETQALFNHMTNWKKRVFRQIWYRIKQHWTAEKWVRVTDDYNKLRWVGFNVPVTVQQLLQETIEDKAKPLPMRVGAQAKLQELSELQDPRLQQVIEVKNPIPELDMDILLEQSVNSINVQQEQFRMLFELAQARPEIPLTALLRLSELRDKEDLIREIEAQQQALQAAQQQASQLDTADKTISIQGKQLDNLKKQEDIGKTAAETTKTNMQAISEQIQNAQMISAPDPNPQVMQ